MTNLEIKNLFQIRRLPDSEVKLLCLLLYLPLGLILVILRTILAVGVILLGCSLSDTPIIHKLVNKIACLSLGISVSVENPEQKENVEVYISNSLSIFDHLAMYTATGSVSPGRQMHPALAKGLGLYHFGSITNMDNFKKNALQLISEQKIPVHFYPEDKITNGRALLKFKTYPFAIATKVQPVCINVERPLLNIAVTTMGTSYWIDVFYYMFSPLTNYKIRFLPILEKKSVGDAEFAEIVRQNLAGALKVEASNFTAGDLIEWEKRQLVEQQRVEATPRPVAVDTEIRRMANQVKEVLPHVPLSVIFKDLSKTKSVDTTITNILEGRVHFTPEQPTASRPQPSTSSQTPSTSSSSASPASSSTSSTHPTITSTSGKDLFNTAASTFAKSAQERNKSFQERKEHLIANARRRYIEKHNLDIPI